MRSCIENMPANDVRPPEQDEHGAEYCRDCGALMEWVEGEAYDCHHCRATPETSRDLAHVIESFAQPTGCDYSDKGRAAVLREVAEHLEAALKAIRQYKEG